MYNADAGKKILFYSKQRKYLFVDNKYWHYTNIYLNTN